MNPIHVPLNREVETRVHCGFPYAVVKIDHAGGNNFKDITYECNCSIFKTEPEVIAFIDLIKD
jgi:hypothetical protein